MTDGGHKLGEVLRAARETKGVDLTRVERDTKIRERYLSALERGEYRELPGSVYTKGFLRNYGSYLGLDPEYLIDLYRLETSSVTTERPRVPAPPRPIATRRSGAFVVTPGVVFAALLTVAVGAFIAYIGWEFVNFARTPELRITEPPANVNAHPEETITVRGVTAPNARVTVSNLPENPTVEADDEGNFEIELELLPGSNLIEFRATDPVTNRPSETETRTVVVVSEVASTASPAAVGVTLSQPAADAAVTGAVPIAGGAEPSAELQVSAALVEAAAPSFTVADPAGTAVGIQPLAPSPPGPVTLVADGSGTFSGELGLRPGTWDVTVAPARGEPIVRRVTVQPPAGLRGTVRLDGGDSYLEVDQDGTPLADVSGAIASEGESFRVSANQTLRIRAGNAGAIRMTINGITIEAMGDDGQVVEWRISRSGG